MAYRPEYWTAERRKAVAERNRQRSAGRETEASHGAPFHGRHRPGFNHYRWNIHD